MSGWETYDWARLSLAALFILAGTAQLILPPQAQPEPDWLRDARLRYGEGGGDLAPPSRWLRLSGIPLILLGLLQLANPMPLDAGTLTWAGGIFLLVGIIGLVFMFLPFGHWLDAYRQSRLQRRLARGEDAYLEELRSILASRPSYRPQRGMQALFCIAAILLGISYLALGLTR